MAATATHNQLRAATHAWLFEREIENFLRSGDADVGLHSAFGSQLAAAEGLTGSEVSYDFDRRIVDIVDSGVLASHRIVRATFQELERRGLHLELVVLNQLFGHVTPSDIVGFGPLANIVHLTEIAEEARVELALLRGDHAASRLEVIYSSDARRQQLETQIEATQARITRHENRAHRLDDCERGEARAWARLQGKQGVSAAFWEAARAWQWWDAQLADVRGWWTAELAAAEMAAADREAKALEGLLRELGRDPLVRAKATACQHEDLATDVREALRYWTTYHGPPRPAGKEKDEAVVAWNASVRAWECERSAFVHFVVQEAERLRARAFNAYATCRREVSR